MDDLHLLGFPVHLQGVARTAHGSVLVPVWTTHLPSRLFQFFPSLPTACEATVLSPNPMEMSNQMLFHAQCEW